MPDLSDYFGLREELAATGQDARAAAREVDQLRASVDRLTLACHAMWSLLGERAGLKESDLMRKIMEVDLLDGAVDGRVHKSPKTCPKCKRTNAARRIWCLYCNAPISNTAF